VGILIFSLRATKDNKRSKRDKGSMAGWSHKDAIAMERRHIIKGEKRVARQKALRKDLIGKGYNQLVLPAKEFLDLLRESLELSRERVRYLEDPPEPPAHDKRPAGPMM
jgi:hypothetical protein